MVKPVNIQEAKSQLSRLIQRAEAGEDIVIARNGKPVARLTGFDAGDDPIGFGFAKGKGWISDDFNKPMDEAWLDEMESGGLI